MSEQQDEHGQEQEAPVLIVNAGLASAAAVSGPQEDGD